MKTAITIAGAFLIAFAVGAFALWLWWPVENADIGRVIWFSVGGYVVLPVAIASLLTGIGCFVYAYSKGD